MPTLPAFFCRVVTMEMTSQKLTTPPRPAIPEADAALLVAQLGAGFWFLGVFARMMRQVIGRGAGFLSLEMGGFEAAFCFLWIACLVGGIILGRNSLRKIRESEDETPGRGEAIGAIALCAATLAITLVGLIGLAIAGMLSGK
jgi:hypothetical protein